MRGRVAGVIVAGGASRRMGEDKAFLLCRDRRTFLQRGIERLLPLVPTVIVAGRKAEDQQLLVGDAGEAQRVVVIPDRDADCGPLAGILAAFDWLEASSFPPPRSGGLLVTPVDMPEVTTADCREILAAAAAAKDEKRPVVASFDGLQREPLLGYYPQALHHALRLLADSPHRSLQRWLAATDHTLLRLPPRGQVNLNTPAQLAAWRHSTAGEISSPAEQSTHGRRVDESSG